jgi:hypothetical protein
MRLFAALRIGSPSPPRRRDDRCGGYGIVASPVVTVELIVAPTRERSMLVLKAGGRGEVTKSHALWSFRSGPDVPTPVTDGHVSLRDQ